MAGSTALPAWAAYLCLVPVLVMVIWHLNTTLFPPPPAPALLRGKRIILLIAHPDDESMFFSPTLLRLTDPALGNHVKVLCLSSGNADGLGETRKKELEAAALTLGVRKREDVFIVDDPAKFKDGMQEKWDEKQIANVLAQAFAPDAVVSEGHEKKRVKKSASKDGPRATIDTIVTFDAHGVSSHPNHIALFYGARVFLQNLMRDHSGYACPITLYTLTSTNIVRKYAFILDILPTYFTGIVSDIIAGASGKKKPSRSKGVTKGSKGDRAVFLNDVAKYFKARDAMVNGHKSQMVWFRWGWIGIGRYMVVNDLKREDM